MQELHFLVSFISIQFQNLLFIIMVSMLSHLYMSVTYQRYVRNIGNFYQQPKNNRHTFHENWIELQSPFCVCRMYKRIDNKMNQALFTFYSFFGILRKRDEKAWESIFSYSSAFLSFFGHIIDTLLVLFCISPWLICRCLIIPNKSILVCHHPSSLQTPLIIWCPPPVE